MGLTNRTSRRLRSMIQAAMALSNLQGLPKSSLVSCIDFSLHIIVRAKAWAWAWMSSAW